MIKKNKRNAGFTLVEVTVYMLISSIVLVVVAQMMGSMSGLFTNTRTRSETKQVGDAVYSYIAEELRYATYLAIHDHTVTDATGSIRLLTYNGNVERNGKEVFSEEFYLGNTIETQIDGINAYTLKLTVRVRDKQGEVRYETGSTIECINIKITGLGLMYTATDSVNPSITYTRGTTA